MAEPTTSGPAPVTLDVPGAGTVAISRIRGDDGTEYADIRLRATLPGDPAAAQLRLTTLHTHLSILLGPARPAHAYSARSPSPA
jgi:hypothetical protein